MRTTPDTQLREDFIVMQQLSAGFRTSQQDVVAYAICYACLATVCVLAPLKLAHHFLDLPSMAFMWELLLSLCA